MATSSCEPLNYQVQDNRYIEKLFAVYSMALAFVISSTDALSYHVYEPMLSLMGVTGWSYCLALISLGHVIALWLNGHNPRISAPMRFATCVGHTGFLTTVAGCFAYSGAIWPVLTMALFITLLFDPLKSSFFNLMKVLKIWPTRKNQLPQ